jgi:hypothetical protein
MIRTMGYETDNEGRTQVERGEMNIAIREEFVKKSMFNDIVGNSLVLQSVITGVAK